MLNSHGFLLSVYSIFYSSHPHIYFRLRKTNSRQKLQMKIIIYILIHI